MNALYLAFTDAAGPEMQDAGRLLAGVRRSNWPVAIATGMEFLGLGIGPAALPSGDKPGPYEILAPIGAGGSGGNEFAQNT